MGWELVFWDAKSPDSALGILAECVLGNVKPTGNRGFPLKPSSRWARVEKSRVYAGTGPGVQEAEYEGVYVHGRVESVRRLPARQEGYMCKGGGWVLGGGCLEQRGVCKCEKEMLAGKMCVQRR